MTRQLPGQALERLAEQHDVEVWGGDLPPEPEALRGHMAGKAGLICLLTDSIDSELLDAAPQLRVIANYAVGYDNIDIEAVRKREIAVGITPGVLTEATADLAFALILAARRGLGRAADEARAGAWRTWEPNRWLGGEMSGATLGIVGMGRVGSAVARRAEGFGTKVISCGSGGGSPDLDQLLARADMVSLHCPLTEATRGLIGPREFGLMRPEAVLINTARGPIVDTDALVEALESGEIGGAALDVTDPEPLPADHPLYSASNALIVPHIGSATREARARMADMAVANLLAGLAGEALPHPVPAR